MTWLRLTFRLQRSTIVFAAIVCLGLAALAAWVSTSVGGADCVAAAGECGMVSVLGSPIGGSVLLTQMAIGIATYAVPLVLGVPVVTQEVERRTAMIAWPLARSRPRWLAWRAGSVLVVGLALIGILALAAEQLAQASAAGSDVGFLAHGSRGISLVVRSMLMFAVAVAVGAAIGRLLPALLVGLALAFGLSMVVDMLPPYAVAPTELTLAETQGHPLQTGYGYRDPDGSLLTADEAEAMSMAVFAEYSPDLPPDSALPQDVLYGIAGSRYVEVLARESAALGGVTLLAALGAVLILHRRRPE